MNDTFPWCFTVSKELQFSRQSAKSHHMMVLIKFSESDIENDGETSPAILSNLLKVYQKDRIYLIKITNFVLTAPEMATQRENLSSDFADKVLDQFQAKLKSDAGKAFF